MFIEIQGKMAQICKDIKRFYLNVIKSIKRVEPKYLVGVIKLLFITKYILLGT